METHLRLALFVSVVSDSSFNVDGEPPRDSFGTSGRPPPIRSDFMVNDAEGVVVASEDRREARSDGRGPWIISLRNSSCGVVVDLGERRRAVVLCMRTVASPDPIFAGRPRGLELDISTGRTNLIGDQGRS